IRLCTVCHTKRSSASTDSHTDMFKSMRGSSKAWMAVALPLSSWSRQTKPGVCSAIALTRSRLLTKSAMRGSSSGERMRPILSWARCSIVVMGASPALLRRHLYRFRVRVCAVVVDASLDLVAEMADQPLHGPGRAVAERADGVALDLGRDLHQHVDLALVRAAFRHAAEHPPHPTHAFAAGRALAAALVLVEIRDPSHGADDIGRFVHHDHSGRAERGFELPGAVEIHEQMLAVAGRDQRHRGAAGNDGEQVIPTAAHAAAMGVE